MNSRPLPSPGSAIATGADRPVAPGSCCKDESDRARRQQPGRSRARAPLTGVSRGRDLSLRHITSSVRRMRNVLLSHLRGHCSTFSWVSHDLIPPMSHPAIGVQLYTVRDACRDDFLATLRRRERDGLPGGGGLLEPVRPAADDGASDARLARPGHALGARRSRDARAAPRSGGRVLGRARLPHAGLSRG